jgi:hypothetical protein
MQRKHKTSTNLITKGPVRLNPTPRLTQFNRKSSSATVWIIGDKLPDKIDVLSGVIFSSISENLLHGMCIAYADLERKKKIE